MLREIAQVTRMLDFTLNYLREDVRSESASRIDLPSVLQTICAEFADVGHAVSYEGPGRLTWRSEEHTSELQSLMRISYAVFCLKKKINTITYQTSISNTIARSFV